MKLSTILVVLAAVAASGARASDDTFAVGVPESITNSGSTTALGNPVHASVEDIEGRTGLGHPVSISSVSSALGVPVSVGHPVEERSASSSSTVGDVTQKTPQELALESIVKIYGVVLPTPAPTTYVTPAPTSPTPAPTYTTPAPTVPTPAPTYTTPAPTVPTPAPTTTSSDASVSDSNAAIKQVEIPAETPAATLATESPATDAPTELLRDSEAAASTTMLAADDATIDDNSTSIAVPAAILGCVAAALAVAVVVLVQKKRTQKATAKTASPSNGEEVDYNNEMVTPV